ncbi:unnamed protein product [Amoebophrya sp. A25]|nr:unnamed protein product [Amoebophrya sp. A25]|eukprot:GSA25T00003881001.1
MSSTTSLQRIKHLLLSGAVFGLTAVFSGELAFSTKIESVAASTLDQQQQPTQTIAVVAGATGRTGALTYKSLVESTQGKTSVRAIVRNADKARKVLGCTTCDERDGIFVVDIASAEEANLRALDRAMVDATSLIIATSASPQCPHVGSGQDREDQAQSSGSVVLGYPHSPASHNPSHSPFRPEDCTYPPGQFPKDVDWDGGRRLVNAFAKAGGRGVVLISARGTTEPRSFLDRMGPDGYISFYKLNLEAFVAAAGLDSFVILKSCGLVDGPVSQNERDQKNTTASTSFVVGHDDEEAENPYRVMLRSDLAALTAYSSSKRSLLDLRFDICASERAEIRPSKKQLADVLRQARRPWNNNTGKSSQYDVNGEIFT